jgi:hypothetical protein
MKPRSVTCTPALSASILLPLGERPTATSTRSQVPDSIAGVAPASAASNDTAMPFFDASTLAALVFRCTATPCFFRRSASGLTRSLSAPGISWSMNSTTVTSLPSARYTVAISRPMMPPPTTSSFFGTSCSSSASVESMMRGSSHGKFGSFTACEPAAMMHCSKRSNCVLPSSPAISSSLGETNLPTPCTVRTLRCLAMPARPLVNWPTTLFCLKSRSLSRSSFGLPKSMPMSAECEASSISAAACSNAFDGMQPTLRQTPPSVA